MKNRMNILRTVTGVMSAVLMMTGTTIMAFAAENEDVIFMEENTFVVDDQDQAENDAARQQAIADAIAARDAAYARFEDANGRYIDSNLYDRAEAARAEVDAVRAAVDQTQTEYDELATKIAEYESEIKYYRKLYWEWDSMWRVSGGDEFCLIESDKCGAKADELTAQKAELDAQMAVVGSDLMELQTHYQDLVETINNYEAMRAEIEFDWNDYMAAEHALDIVMN